MDSRRGMCAIITDKSDATMTVMPEPMLVPTAFFSVQLMAWTVPVGTMRMSPLR